MKHCFSMNIFCSGIGGTGLSAYAAYQKACGHIVSGSDYTESAVTRDLQSRGISISFVQDGGAVPEDADLFVYTLALPNDHPEKKRAEDLGILQRTYFQALGDLTRDSRLIAVCGTHGKTSTTAMASKVLLDADFDPSVILGAKTPDLSEGNWRKGHSEYFLVEACEYRRSFLHLSPEIILLTNVTGDHFDAFEDMDDYRKAFSEFIVSIKSNGTLIANCSDTSLSNLIDEARERGVTIIDADEYEYPKLSVPGRHMQENARLVLAMADILEIVDANKSLSTYKGCSRRTEIKGAIDKDVLLIDDYAHHPNEIRATLQGLKGHYPKKRLVCVFQPHTHDRTIKLYNEFLGAFAAADIVVLTDIFAARSDRDAKKVDPEKFSRDIEETSLVQTVYGRSLIQTLELLQNKILKENDLLVTMGAGDVWKISESVVSMQSKHAPVCTSPSDH